MVSALQSVTARSRSLELGDHVLRSAAVDDNTLRVLSLTDRHLPEPDPLSVLDNPVWWALTGQQHALGTVQGSAARFRHDVSPFGAIAEADDERAWHDAATLVGPAGTAVLVGDDVRPPVGWTIQWQGSGVQMIAGSDLTSGPLPSAPRDTGYDLVPLGTADAEDMLALVEVARPGPFLSRTVELGGYVGLRRRGQLVAMAGERLRPEGFTEISAVATHPDHRRQGLGEFLVRRVAASITERGDTPFLHASGDNTAAIRLYASMGFRVRRTAYFTSLEAPGPPTA
jgi:ribosomal protein S18 acetylase RimI-like enzyme